MRSAARLLGLTFLLFRCAGTQLYPTGIPMRAAPNFFFHMENAAQKRGWPASTIGDRLIIRTPAGEHLVYRPDGLNRGIVVEVVAHTQLDGKALDQALIDERKRALKAVSDELIKEARAAAAFAEPFSG